MNNVKHFTNPTDFNSLVLPLAECEQKKSDNNNGYYIVAGFWGTCFFRIATKRDYFDITRFKDPVADRTYTKIPVAKIPNVFFVYVNYKKDSEPVILLPKGGSIIGMHDPQPSGAFLNASFLVYCPTGEAPTVEREEGAAYDPSKVTVQRTDGVRTSIGIDDILQGKPFRLIYTEPQGFIIPNQNATPPRTRDLMQVIAEQRSARGDRSSPNRR